MAKLAPHLFAYVKKSCLETCSRIRTGDEHKREHQQIADLPELNENKEKGLDNLQLPAFIVASFISDQKNYTCLTMKCW